MSGFNSAVVVQLKAEKTFENLCCESVRDSTENSSGCSKHLHCGQDATGRKEVSQQSKKCYELS